MYFLFFLTSDLLLSLLLLTIICNFLFYFFLLIKFSYVQFASFPFVCSFLFSIPFTLFFTILRSSINSKIIRRFQWTTTNKLYDVDRTSAPLHKINNSFIYFAVVLDIQLFIASFILNSVWLKIFNYFMLILLPHFFRQKFCIKLL